MFNSVSWVSFSLYHTQLDKVIKEVIVPLRKEIFERKLARKLIFNRSLAGGENVIAICALENKTDFALVQWLFEDRANNFFKQCPAPDRQIKLPVNDWFLPFPNNYIHSQNEFVFDVMETGGIQAAQLAPELLGKSSDIILGFIESVGEDEDWSLDSAMAIALQFHVAFVLAFDQDLENIACFYEAFFNNILKVAEGDENAPHFEQELVKGLEENFNDQKEALVGFIDEIIAVVQGQAESEDQWLSDWYKCCIAFSHQIKQLQSNGEFITPEQFIKNDRISVPEQTQELWPIFEYFLRAVNAQLGIENSYEINLVYSLQESIKYLSAANV